MNSKDTKKITFSFSHEERRNLVIATGLAQAASGEIESIEREAIKRLAEAIGVEYKDEHLISKPKTLSLSIPVSYEVPLQKKLDELNISKIKFIKMICNPPPKK